MKITKHVEFRHPGKIGDMELKGGRDSCKHLDLTYCEICDRVYCSCLMEWQNICVFRHIDEIELGLLYDSMDNLNIPPEKFHIRTYDYDEMRARLRRNLKV